MLRLTRGAFPQARLAAAMLILAVAAGVAPPAVLAEALTVQVRETSLRSAPGPFARILQTLPYAATVEIVERKGGWSRVAARDDRPAGWVHDGALTDSRVELDAGSTDVGTDVSDDEIALAGKGFGPEVEARYREDEGLDFGWVDRMERDFSIADPVKQRFLREGNLDVR